MRKYCLILIASLFLSGCIGLSPSEDPTRFYLIAPPTDRTTSGSEATADSKINIGIRRVVAPEYLHSSKMAVRKGGYEISYSEFNRWGEDVERSIARTVAHSLEASPAIGFVSIFPWPTEVEHDYLLRLRFSNFEGGDDSVVRIAGEWSIIDVEGRRLVHFESFQMTGTWNTRDYGSLAEALSNLVYSLGENISRFVAQMVDDQSGQPVSRNSQGR